MSTTNLRRSRSPRLRRAVPVVAVLTTATLGLAGCGSIAKAVAVHAARHLLPHDAALDTFTTKVNLGDETPYAATYVTTGGAPTTIEYAALPPHDVAFDGTQAGGGLEIIQNAKEDLACTHGSAAAAPWSCTKLVGQGVETYHAIYALYTGQYWVDFLSVYSTVAGRIGVTITSSKLTVNGFDLTCIDVDGGKSNPGTSRWCVTSKGILGYVGVSSASAAFEIKAFSSSPSPSLFEPPPGATITTLPTTTTVASATT